MHTVYDFVTVICFIFAVLTYFIFTEGGTKVLAHFMLSAAAFAIANQVGNHAGNDVLMNVLAAALKSAAEPGHSAGKQASCARRVSRRRRVPAHLSAPEGRLPDDAQPIGAFARGGPRTAAH